MEGEDAAGHRGQEEGEAETESKCEQAQARCPQRQCRVFGRDPGDFYDELWALEVDTELCGHKITWRFMCQAGWRDLGMIQVATAQIAISRYVGRRYL